MTHVWSWVIERGFNKEAKSIERQDSLEGFSFFLGDLKHKSWDLLPPRELLEIHETINSVDYEHAPSFKGKVVTFPEIRT